MAVTIGNFTAINDSEVDAESPITESLMTRLRDNAYWVNAGTQKSSETTANKFLETAGSGVLQWTDTSTIGVDGTKGQGSTASTFSFAKTADKFLLISGYETDVNNKAYAGVAFIDTSDDTLVSASHSITISGSAQTWALLSNSSSSLSATFQIKLNGANYEITGGSSASYLYL